MESAKINGIERIAVQTKTQTSVSRRFIQTKINETPFF